MKKTLKKLNQKQTQIKIFEEFKEILEKQIRKLLEKDIDENLLNRSFPLQYSNENFDIETLYGINNKFSILYLNIKIKKSFSLTFKRKIKISINVERRYYEKKRNGEFISPSSITKIKLYKIEKHIKELSKYNFKLLLDFPKKLDNYLYNNLN